jgi:hypothetical protein
MTLDFVGFAQEGAFRVSGTRPSQTTNDYAREFNPGERVFAYWRDENGTAPPFVTPSCL